MHFIVGVFNYNCFCRDLKNNGEQVTGFLCRRCSNVRVIYFRCKFHDKLIIFGTKIHE